MGFALAQQMAGALGGAQQPHAAPPPLPQAAAFFVAINGQQAGPFDLTTIAAKARAGEISQDSLVWKQGMPAWAPASSVPDLAAAFGSIPPPLPPR
jgi:hypothetical protein